uniref:Uncharacterized protein n=1 Tax=Solibacter usitatus (strain Ellin6076) TaxID=234267 RepID=Q023Y5_SOLUE
MLNVLKQARAAFSLLRPQDILESAERPVHVGLVADGSSAYAEMEDFLAPAGTPRAEWMRQMSQIHRANDPKVPERVDIVLYEPGLPCPQGAYTFHRGHPEDTVAEILHDKSELSLALARQFPAFRRQVVEHTIHMVARENALFAIATALPNVVPNFIELPWALGEFASDTAFLTTNQVRLAFQIAAACGKDVGLAHQKGTVLTIATSAFGWRAIARELVSHIPLGGGLIPKGAIAYAGTYVVGKSLEFLLVQERPHTNEERERLYQEGLDQGRRVAGTLRESRA